MRQITQIDPDTEEETIIKMPIDRTGMQLHQLVFESYFIRSGFVTLSLNDLRELDAEYAGRLYITLQEQDKIINEKREEQRKNR
jgi:hypothetical protein